MAQRPTKKTPEVIERLLEGIADGQTLRALCREEGMPNWRTVYDWIDADAELAARFERAREIGFDAIAEDILTNVDNVVAIGEHIQRSKLQVETRLKLLAKWHPKRYGDKQTVDVGNKEGETLKVESKPVDPMVLAALTEALLSKKTEQ